VCLPFFLAMLLLPRLPSGFLPVSDTSLSLLRVELPSGSTPGEAEDAARRVTATLNAHEDVAHVLTTAESLSEATFTVVLKPRKERRLTRKAFEMAVQPSLAALPDLRFQFL